MDEKVKDGCTDPAEVNPDTMPARAGTVVASILPKPTIDTQQHKKLLTAREQGVLSWLAEGKSGGEIAQLLHLSVPTVRVHIRNIIRKLDASNIPHAVARAFKMGIFTQPAVRPGHEKLRRAP